MSRYFLDNYLLYNRYPKEMIDNNVKTNVTPDYYIGNSISFLFFIETKNPIKVYSLF